MIPIYQVPNGPPRDTRGLAESVIRLATVGILCDIREETDGVVGHQLIISR